VVCRKHAASKQLARNAQLARNTQLACSYRPASTRQAPTGILKLRPLISPRNGIYR
jgi:hypothetical protein